MPSRFSVFVGDLRFAFRALRWRFILTLAFDVMDSSSLVLTHTAWIFHTVKAHSDGK
jgi:hypothetical protein